MGRFVMGEPSECGPWVARPEEDSDQPGAQRMSLYRKAGDDAGLLLTTVDRDEAVELMLCIARYLGVHSWSAVGEG